MGQPRRSSSRDGKSVLKSKFVQSYESIFKVKSNRTEKGKSRRLP